MYALTLMLMLYADKKPILPANPCSNPVKCERVLRPKTDRAGRGPRK